MPPDTSPNTVPDPPRVRFVERDEPPLEAGLYQIAIEQTVTLERNDPTLPSMKPVTETFTHTRQFAVRGERFVLDPDEVIGVFPPPSNNGEYSHVLPHVILKRRTLPWERTPDGTAGASWLAILLFEQDQAPPLKPVQVKDLLQPPADPPTASYRDGNRAFGPKLAERETDPCQVIDVPIDLFHAIAPSVEDLKWLAHVRRVPAGGKADAGTGSELACSLVVGNRLPPKGTTCVVHLVSLEGLGSFLPIADDKGNYTKPKQAIVAGSAGKPASVVRLISLKSWSFTAASGDETFSGYLKKLNVTPSALRRKSDPPASAVVENAFALGYTAVNHETRLGDRTVSWYRGPLLPIETNPTIVPAPGTAGGDSRVIAAADEAVRYDATTGMMDVSYAVAWETGRLLALASKSFSIALYNWKRAASQKTALTLQRETVRQWLAPLAGDSGTPMEAVTHLLTTRLGRHLKSRRAP